MNLNIPELNKWQLLVVMFFLFLSINYLIVLFYDRIIKPSKYENTVSVLEGYEGYEDLSGKEKKSQADESKYNWLDNITLYDDFYTGIYDKLVQGEKRTQIEVSYLFRDWQKVTPTIKPASWIVMDAGCGTGIATAALAKLGVGKIIAVDRSQAMITRAQQKTIPSTTLTADQLAAIDWRVGTFENPNLCKEGELTHACMLYFTIYYAPDPAIIFKNMKVWIRPGGALTVHCVNKFKFDPMLESAAPTAFSLQKYSKRRIMKSQVAFDQFDYEGVFDFDNGPNSNKAEFRETVRFKDGSVRRQRHLFNMPEMKKLVQIAQAAGWTYKGYQDLTSAGFEYAYLLLFTN